MRDDGTMYRRSDSLEFAEKHGIPIITVDQIIEYRKQHQFVEEAADGNIFPNIEIVDRSAINDSKSSEIAVNIARLPFASKL
jgi:hypothetical protein